MGRDDIRQRDALADAVEKRDRKPLPIDRIQKDIINTT